MPNWCYTEYVFKGNPKEIDLFHQKIDEWAKDDTNSPFHVDNDFGDSWLGNIVNNSMEDLEAYNKTRCRGSLIDSDIIEPGMLYLSTETAWCAAPLMWLAILKKLNLNSIRMAFYEEEPGWGLFNIYDPDNIAFSNNLYQVEVFGDALEELEKIEGMVSEVELKRVINKLIPGKGSLDSKIEEICDTYEDVSINKLDRINSPEELWDIYAEDRELEVR